MERDELITLIERHNEWLKKFSGNWFNKYSDAVQDLARLNIQNEVICGVNLTGLCMRKVVFDCATFSGVNFEAADLSEACFLRSVFINCSFNGANLETSTFDQCDIKSCTFINASLLSSLIKRCNVTLCDFSNAKAKSIDIEYSAIEYSKMIDTVVHTGWVHFTSIDRFDFSKSVAFEVTGMCSEFYECNVKDSEFKHCNFKTTKILETDLSKAKEPPHIPLACPEVGSFIGFKKALRVIQVDGYLRNKYEDCVVMLKIPEDAKRSSGSERKCRCDKAEVVKILSMNGDYLPDNTIACSKRVESFEYRVGETVRADAFDERQWVECSHGIHFFTSFDEAAQYSI